MSSPQGLNIEFSCWKKVWKGGVVKGGFCNVVAIPLFVMALPVVYVITVESYFAKSVV